jgi:hypothetical protein
MPAIDREAGRWLALLKENSDPCYERPSIWQNKNALAAANILEDSEGSSDRTVRNLWRLNFGINRRDGTITHLRYSFKSKADMAVDIPNVRHTHPTEKELIVRVSL